MHRLEKWIQEGGCWISIAGVCGMESTFGVTVDPPAYGSWGGGGVNLVRGICRRPWDRRTQASSLN